MSAVLELADVTFRRGPTQILDGIDLRVDAGQHWALIGPNGAGKTTILGFCAAQTHPTSGTVDVLGHRLGRVDMAQLRRHIGHVNPRHPVRSALTVLQVVLTGRTGTVELPMRYRPEPAEVDRARSVITAVGLADREQAPWPIISQGERGRALIARALMAEPELLLLDEPTTGLDVAAREQLLETIDELAAHDPQVASVLVTHHLEELPVSTSHALVIAGGRVVASGPAEQIITTETISTAFSHPIQVGRDEGRWHARAVPRSPRQA